MIIVKLMGGLGNQMFQYAIGRYLSLKYNQHLKLDNSFLIARTLIPNFTFRDFELDNFKLHYNIANKDDLKLFKRNCILNTLYKFNFKRSNIIIREGDTRISKINLYNNIYLEGFWQSEKYFYDIKNIISKDFIIKNDLIFQQKIFFQKYLELNTISVHIRRGDYVSNINNQNYHGICSIDYYMVAIEYFKSKFHDTHFIFFSDDMDWTINNFKSLNINKTFISRDISNSPISDLFLMKQCKHNIIANSTFSWWGAWLNDNTSKIVIAPLKWTIVDNPNLANIIPNTWIRF
jgi:hypothetical protein